MRLSVFGRTIAAASLLFDAFIPVPCSAQKLDASLGWTYTHSDQITGFADLNGWYGSLNYNLLPRLGLTVEQESYWGSLSGTSLNNHIWLGGVTWQLADSQQRVIPFVQPLAGAMRAASSITSPSNWEAVWTSS